MIAWAPVHAAVDLTKTWIALSKDYYDIAMETMNEIQETLSEAGKRGKWYHKVANVWVIAPVWSAAKFITWNIQTVINPLVNGVFNFAKTWWGFLKNEFNSVKSVFSKTPVSDFSFAKLKLTPTRKSWRQPKNLLIGWAATAAVTAGSPDSDSTPAPQAVVAQTPSDDSETKKTITDLTVRLEKQDKDNQELQKSIIAMQDQTKQQTQLMQQQIQQKDAMIAALQADNTKQIAQEWIKSQVEEWLDSDRESPKKKASKKQPVT